MKKNIWGPVIILFVLVTALSAYQNSFQIALDLKGMNGSYIQYIDVGIDDNGSEYRTVFQVMPEETVKLCRLTRNRLGIWRVADLVSGPEAGTEQAYIEMGWTRFSSFRQYSAQEEAQIDAEVHRAYAGRNAVRQIEIPLELLPPNVAVNVFQAGPCYVLHFVSYGEEDALDRIDITALLEETDSISRK